MNRRSMILGLSAVALTPALAHARAYGASGWMTKRINAARDAGKAAFHAGQPFSDNPHAFESEEFFAWFNAYATEFALSAMTPEQRAAHEAKKLQDAAEYRKLVEQGPAGGKTVIAVGSVLLLGMSGFCIWVLSLANGNSKASEPSGETRP